MAIGLAVGTAVAIVGGGGGFVGSGVRISVGTGPRVARDSVTRVWAVGGISGVGGVVGAVDWQAI